MKTDRKAKARALYGETPMKERTHPIEKRARGGATKKHGKTQVNVIVASAPQQPQRVPVPVPVGNPAGPPRPVMAGPATSGPVPPPAPMPGGLAGRPPMKRGGRVR